MAAPNNVNVDLQNYQLMHKAQKRNMVGHN
jgi:hypothetical protein